MQKYYKFGKTYIEINKKEEIPFPKNLELFEVEKTNKEVIHYNLSLTHHMKEEVNKLPEKIGNIDIRKENIHVYESQLGECREVYFVGEDLPYALSIAQGNNTYDIVYDEKVKEEMNIEPLFLAPFQLERVLMKENSMILHSVNLCVEDQSILFTAPSGVGKSTQGMLWEKYHQGSYQVNGDKSLIYFNEDTLIADGWLICGSSQICLNETHQVKAIVVVSQAKENKVIRLNDQEIYKELIPQLTINMWNQDYWNKALSFIDKIIKHIPVYRLECNISKEAVECLEKELYKEKDNVNNGTRK